MKKRLTVTLDARTIEAIRNAAVFLSVAEGGGNVSNVVETSVKRFLAKRRIPRRRKPVPRGRLTR